MPSLVNSLKVVRCICSELPMSLFGQKRKVKSKQMIELNITLYKVFAQTEHLYEYTHSILTLGWKLLGSHVFPLFKWDVESIFFLQRLTFFQEQSLRSYLTARGRDKIEKSHNPLYSDVFSLPNI